MSADWADLSGELEGVAISHRMRPGNVPILCVHGIGPGTTGLLNFAPLISKLAETFALHVIDLAGFGASGRLPAHPFFDVRFWLKQIGQAIDRIRAMHGRPPMLLGNSCGAALVLKMAAQRRDIAQVLAIAIPAPPPATAVLRDFWRSPRHEAMLADAMRPMTGALSAPDRSLVRARQKPFLEPGYADYFDAMLADPDACLAAMALAPDEAARITADVALLHGRLDRACPVGHALDELMQKLPHADVTLLGGSGHNVISERTEDAIATIERLAAKGENA